MNNKQKFYPNQQVLSIDLKQNIPALRKVIKVYLIFWYDMETYKYKCKVPKCESKYSSGNGELCNLVKRDYINHINFNHVDQNERILEDDEEFFDYQFATRNHVKKMFTNNYELSILLKGIKERENVVILDGHYSTILDNYIVNMSCSDPKLLEIILVDYKQRVDWTRSFVNMC
ncbi:hypothetical protein FQA39_LY03346 [Lamprigera yunnana]|nr:hypothetical protein FQA39_LY03346 [Lamprigera yunnana]